MSLDPFKTTWEDPTEEDKPDFLPTNPRPMQRYPHTLPHDIALAGGVEEDIWFVLNNHGISPAEYDHISDMPEFRRELSEWRQKMQSEGYGFKLKLRAIAEAYVPEIISLLNDRTGVVAPSVKTALFKDVVKWAGLEPKKEESESSGDSNKITINIAPYAAQPTATTIDITPKVSCNADIPSK